MTDLTNIRAGQPSRAMAGIASVMLGMLFFVGQDGMMKSMLGAYPVWLLIVDRGIVAVLVLTPAILILGGQNRLITPLWPLHLLRAALFTVAFTLFYTAFPFMGLAEVTTIFFAAPLMVAALAALWLGETVGIRRISALIVGFAGVVVAMNPTGESFQWVAILPLFCAVLYAVSQILARKIGERETTLTTGLYTIAFSGILIVPIGWLTTSVFETGPEFHHLRWEWQVELGQFDWLLLLGLVGMFGYMLINRAYQIANASVVAPFDYCYLPMATAMAWIVWDEVPAPNTLVGMALIVASGLYLGFRELRDARRAIEPPPTAEAVFAPGNPTAPLALAADVEEPRGLR